MARRQKNPGAMVALSGRQSSRRDEEGLTPVSYALLGAMATKGPLTPYQLKQLVAETLGYFWSFSHGQIYSEPARLVAAGFVTEVREETSRRRRVLAITDAGRAVLRSWLAAPTESRREVRDTGMMKLFFSEASEPDELEVLIKEQLAVHQRWLDQFRESRAMFVDRADLGNRPVTIEMAILFEQAAVEFWSKLEIDADGRVRWGDAEQERSIGNP